VTGLAEFSPFGRLFTLGSFWQITEIAQIIGATYFCDKKLHFNFDKKRLWLRFGRFLISASGHPGMKTTWTGMPVALKSVDRLQSRVATWHSFKPKNPVWVNFGGSCNGR
jgi:hypothetical protein